MIINFMVYEISRDIYKLTRTLLLIKKNLKQVFLNKNILPKKWVKRMYKIDSYFSKLILLNINLQK
jgi:hypothetical protein